MFQIIRSISDLPNLVLQMDEQATKAYPTFAYLTDDYETIRDAAKPKKLIVTKGEIALPGADARRNGVATNYFVMIKKQP